MTGELFFASSDDLYDQFDFNETAPHVVVDLSGAHLWDASTIAILDAVSDAFEDRGKRVEIIGLDEPQRRPARSALRAPDRTLSTRGRGGPRWGPESQRCGCTGQ